MRVAYLVIVFLLISNLAVRAESEALKGMARGMNGSDDMSPCTNPHSPAEKRVEFCKMALRGGRDDIDSVEFTLSDLYSIEGNFDAALMAVGTTFPAWPAGSEPRREDLASKVYSLEVRSTIYAQMGRFDEAKKDADEIQRIDPDKDEDASFVEQCWIRAVAGKELDQALADCDKALSLKSDDATALGARGLVYFKLGNFQEALRNFEASVGEDRHMNTSRFGRGVAKLRLGEVAGGNDDIRDATNRQVDIAREMTALGISP